MNAGNDQGTPLGLQWYNARYADGIAFPFADTSRPVDASFRCGKCNSRTNPCLYEGICQDDGTCGCSHGASGGNCARSLHLSMEFAIHSSTLHRMSMMAETAGMFEKGHRKIVLIKRCTHRLLGIAFAAWPHVRTRIVESER